MPISGAAKCSLCLHSNAHSQSAASWNNLSFLLTWLGINAIEYQSTFSPFSFCTFLFSATLNSTFYITFHFLFDKIWKQFFLLQKNCLFTWCLATYVKNPFFYFNAIFSGPVSQLKLKLKLVKTRLLLLLYCWYTLSDTVWPGNSDGSIISVATVTFCSPWSRTLPAPPLLPELLLQPAPACFISLFSLLATASH